MKAEGIKFQKFLSESKTFFLIPVYQRNYDWKKKQCTEFLKDLEALIQGERDNHFLGSIVYIKGEDEDDLTKYIIIDGQQRITTIMLFLKAIYDLSQNKWEKEDILSYLTNRIRGKNELKLKPIKNDGILHF